MCISTFIPDPARDERECIPQMRIRSKCSLCLAALHGGGSGRTRLLLLIRLLWLILKETLALSERRSTERARRQPSCQTVCQNGEEGLWARCRVACPSTTCWKQSTPQLECHGEATEAVDPEAWLVIWRMNRLMDWTSERCHVDGARLVVHIDI